MSLYWKIELVCKFILCIFLNLYIKDYFIYY